MSGETHTMADGREVIVDRYVEGGRYNVYECPGSAENAPKVVKGSYVAGTVAHSLLSMDVDDGVTPFMVACPDHPVSATSRMYPKGEPPFYLFPVRMLWRLATPGERKRERQQGGSHYADGGLAREWVGVVEPAPIAAVPFFGSRQARRAAARKAARQ